MAAGFGIQKIARWPYESRAHEHKIINTFNAINIFNIFKGVKGVKGVSC